MTRSYPAGLSCVLVHDRSFQCICFGTANDLHITIRCLRLNFLFFRERHVFLPVSLELLICLTKWFTTSEIAVITMITDNVFLMFVVLSIVPLCSTECGCSVLALAFFFFFLY